MKVEDVMTRNVITVTPQSSLKAVAEILASKRISGVPVVDDKRVLGVVSEADIVEKEAVEAQPTLLTRLLGRRRPDAKRAARTGAGRDDLARRHDLSSTRHRASRPAQVERAINRLPVVTEDGGLVGIVTRADVVRAFVRSDDEIARSFVKTSP